MSRRTLTVLSVAVSAAWVGLVIVLTCTHFHSQWVLMMVTALTGFITVTLGTGFLLRWFIPKILPHSDTDQEDDGIDMAGFTIGAFERALIYIAALALSHELAALVVAVSIPLTIKSLVRIKGLEDKRPTAEYYLVGTLASYTVGLIVSIGTLFSLGLLH
jgi:hypothetical protein